MPKLPTKTFASFFKVPIEQPPLTAIQLDSYRWFREKGLKEIFSEFSPIEDYSSHNLEISFSDYYFGEPKYTEIEAQTKSITYSAPLRASVKLTHASTGRNKEQEVYLGEFPMMTDRGTFIINGVERVVISQLSRSPGVYFVINEVRGRKLFGSKIIPNRGAWLEFETDLDGSVWVKIDRRRKLAVTSLLRIFGLPTDEEIVKRLGEIIGPTLKKDSAHSIDESFLEIYKRLRPGDLARAEDARRLVEAMFTDPNRYDLGSVGRFKVNQRLAQKEESNLIVLDDLIAIIKELVRLNKDNHAQPDDIDHLGNRRVKSVGELLQARVRIGFMRLRRHIQDKMAAGEFEDLEPASLTNSRLISSVVEEFFSSSQLSQFADQENPLSEIEHRRRLTVLGPGGLVRERAGIEVRDVHHSSYGRICPIETPEGHNIGLVNHLTMYARLDEHGFLITPYYEVKKSRVTDKVFWLNAIEDEDHKIASANTRLDKEGNILDEKVEARIKGEPGICAREEVDLIEVAPNQLISLSTSLIPFLEHDDANRSLMASNMQRQAVPSLNPEAPYVGTGVEETAAMGSGAVTTAKRAGLVTEVDAAHVVIKTDDGEKDEYHLKKFKMSNQNTTITERPVVFKGDKIKKGEIIAESASSDHGALALGQNLLVAFMPFDGGNFEDAVILSERVQMENRFTSIHTEDFPVDVRDTKLGPEITTPDIPNVAETKLKNLDEEGIIRIGAEVRGGDILVGKISPKGESELMPEEKLLQAIFGEKARDVKDTSLYLPSGKSGRVVGIKILSRERGDKLDPGVISRIQVQVAELRNIQAGDKVAVRHGNKGVISQVRPMEDMPHLADGTPVDVILNPLGVPSRMNLGQILETHLGWAAKSLGYRAVTPAFAGAKEEEIKQELKAAGLPEDGQIALYDGRTGVEFKRKVTVGIIYMMKLNHMVVDKVHMRSVGPYSLITQQPLRGKAQLGGQRFGEMEVWALEGHGAPHTLQEMLTIKSDDVPGRGAAYEAIIRGEEIKKPNVPASFNVLVSELKALGLAVTPLAEGEEINFNPEEDE
ncbi:MAG TPA: DNA-directed RNA polymerase subunit beta [Candidatus Tyrphobacter sp.]|nr:DNA-directed RNA polymerase subunit beta [Candidatus Tyrphobacter sp.]